MAVSHRIFAAIMGNDYRQTHQVADQISRDLASGRQIGMDTVSSLMTAYERDTTKKDMISSMVAATLAENIDKVMRDTGYRYSYSFRGESATLHVLLEEGTQAVFGISAADLQQRLSTLPQTLDMLASLLRTNGAFTVSSSKGVIWND